jgi:predicted PurR-regulated permease PerM
MTAIAPENPSPASETTPETTRTLQAAPQAVKRSIPMALSITLGILMAGCLFWFAYQLTWFILLLYLSFVIATIVEAPVRWLISHHIPRTTATVGLMAGALAILTALGYLAFLYVYVQFTAVAQDFQNLPDRANAWFNGISKRWPAFGQLIPSHDITTRIQESLPSVSAVAQNGMKGAELLTYTVVTFFVVTYMVVEGPEHLKSFRRVFPKHTRLEVTHVFEEMVVAHRGWFVATLANTLSSACMTALALWFLGIPGAIILGLIAGLGELVPNIGPLISNAPILLFVLVVAPQKVWFFVLIFIVVQTIQGYGISPQMIKRTVRLPILSTLISVLIMGTLFGGLGVVVAIPLTADMVVLWNYFNKQLERDAPDGDTVNEAPAERAAIEASKPGPSNGRHI